MIWTCRCCIRHADCVLLAARADSNPSVSLFEHVSTAFRAQVPGGLHTDA